MRHLSNLLWCALYFCVLGAMPASAVRIPGGPQGDKALAADCYGEIDVAGVSGDDVATNKRGLPTIGCLDGTACDHGAAYDDSCTFRVALCAAQHDVDGCAAPAALKSFRGTAKINSAKKGERRVTLQAGPLTEGCGEFIDVVVPVKRAKNGSRVAGTAMLKLVAKAPAGVAPRTDKDSIVLSCEPIPPGACVDSTRCNDGNPCTADVCSNGVCSNPQGVDCSTPPDACRVAGTCDPASGQCVYPPAEDGISCGDCATCVGGVCQPDAPGESLKCDDGNFCTSDLCTNGTCSHPVTFDCSTPPDACHVAPGECDAGSGQCVYPPAPPETVCGDCKACDGAGACVDHFPSCEPGTCGIRTVEGCSVGSLCFCSECSTCVSGACQPLEDGTACSTGICSGGACGCSQDADCAASSSACVKGICVDGSCSIALVDAGEPCIGQDGVCDADAACVLQCQGGDASPCSSNKCETYTCDHGRCVLEGPVVCPLPPDIPDCYGPAFCNPETGNCDRTYVGDERACGLENSGNTTMCCGGECASLFTDSANCGACGNACVNSVCFQGACFDGCVIDGKRYVDGEPDPANQCRVCKTAFSRTSWSPLDSSVGNIHYCNKGGCVQSQCYKGQCGCGTDPTCAVLVPENSTGGCVSTPCADAVCENNVCVYHAKAEGQDCNAAFDPRSRLARGYDSNCTSNLGTCQSGICTGGPGSDGVPCLVEDPFADGVCREPEGVCIGGECAAQGWYCLPRPAYCNQPVTVTCDPATSLASCQSNSPPPASGTIACGTAVDPEGEKCCAGQLCVCPPTAFNVCFALECWNKTDLAAL